MYKYIAIERQYASGGNEIGRRVAKKLGIELYDRNILIEAAKRLDIPAIYVENLEETAPGSIIFNLSKTGFGGSKKDNPNVPMAEKLFLEEKSIIEEIVDQKSCVIVGRCATNILKGNSDCLKVFMYADDDFRMKRAVETEKIAPAEAKDMIAKIDKRRSSFYNMHTGLKWGEYQNFDICLNTGSIGMDECVNILVNAFKG